MGDRLATGPGGLAWAALIVGVSAVVLASLVYKRLDPPAPGRRLDEWWGEQLGRAILIWSLFEMPAIIGAVTLLTTRDYVIYGALGGIALVGLIRFRPAMVIRPR
ncbi:MAG: hypothetical protein ACT4PM_06780 [Gemmatimonadales bacterium]